MSDFDILKKLEKLIDKEITEYKTNTQGQIVELDLSKKELSSLPVEIGQLANLQKLDLSGNELSSLPAEIGQLTNLQKFRLAGLVQGRI